MPVPSGSLCDLGEKVTLKFIDLQAKEQNVDLPCEAIPSQPPQRTVQRLEEGSIHLRFDQFQRGTNEWLAEQVRQHHKAPAIILDLRDNLGGILAVVQKSLNLFFERGATLGSFRDRKGNVSDFKIQGSRDNAYRGQVFVLIDEETSSGTELFTGALQESGRATVIGRRSPGVVLIAREHQLPNGFSINIPHHDYRTAKGVRLEQRGVIPDEPIPLTMSDFMQNKDPDLQRVREHLARNRSTSLRN